VSIRVFMKLIICLVGEKGSGKGTVSRYLVEKYGARVFRFSEILDDILGRLYIPNARENQINLAEALREKFGAQVLAKVLKKDVENDNHKLIVLDGIRHPKELETLEQFSNFYLLYITCPLRIRYERSKKRGEKSGEDKMTFEDFKRRESASTEVWIKKIGKKARAKIDNSGTLEKLYKNVDNFITKITNQNSY